MAVKKYLVSLRFIASAITSLLLLITFILNLIHCRPAPQLRGTGLYPHKDYLLWTINIGILNDSEYEELSTATLRPVLQAVGQQISKNIDGLRVNFIIDQPMNAIFLMQRTLRMDTVEWKKLRWQEDSHVIFLEAQSRQAFQKNVQKLSRAGLSVRQVAQEMKLLSDLQKKNTPLGTPVLGTKWTNSAYIWRAYMKKQVRYDLVLTNSFVYADDLHTRSELKRANFGTTLGGRVLWHLCPTLGRSSLEGYGAYVSYQKQRQRINELEAHIYRILLALIWPLGTEAGKAKGVSSLASNGKNRQKTYWNKRLAYLQAIASIHRGKKPKCIDWLDASGRLIPKGHVPTGKQIQVLRASHKTFLKFCQKT